MAAANNPERPIVDQQSTPEIYVDGILNIAMTNGVVRMTLKSDRVDLDDGTTVRQVVVGRLALSAAAFVEVYNQINHVMQQFKDKGLVVEAGEGSKTTQ